MGQTPSNRVFSLRLRASDGLDVYDVTRQFVSPASDPQLQFFIDVAGDGVFELAGGGQNYIEFTVDPGVGQTVVSGFVRHPDGTHADFDELVTLPNSVPNLEEARIITVDSDTFEVFWQRAQSIAMMMTSSTRSIGEMALDDDPCEYYQPPISSCLCELCRSSRSANGRGGRDSQNVGFEFTEPAGNTAPAVDYVTLLDQSGYEVIVAAAATDADGDPAYTYDWGDGSRSTLVLVSYVHTHIPISLWVRDSSPLRSAMVMAARRVDNSSLSSWHQLKIQRQTCKRFTS